MSIQPIGSIRRMENVINDPTSRVSIRSIRRMENIMLDLTYCVLHPKIASHYITDNDPLQACRFGLFVLFGEWKILVTPDKRVSICSIRLMENITLVLTHCVLHPKIASR